MDAASRESRQLTSNHEEDKAPSWSPDGNTIIFVHRSDRTDQYSINVIRSDGSDEKELYTCPAMCDSPRWSPDNSKVSFVMQKSGSNDLYMLNMKDYQLTQMTRRVDVVQPRWSPDGKNLVFAGSESIYRLDMETGQYVKIDPPGFSHSAFPTFSPDGSKILFASFRDGDRTWLYLMKYDGTQIEPVNISDHLLGSVQLDWSSDGKSVLFVPYLGVYRDHFLGQFNLLPPHP